MAGPFDPGPWDASEKGAAGNAWRLKRASEPRGFIAWSTWIPEIHWRFLRRGYRLCRAAGGNDITGTRAEQRPPESKHIAAATWNMQKSPAVHSAELQGGCPIILDCENRRRACDAIQRACAWKVGPIILPVLSQGYRRWCDHQGRSMWVARGTLSQSHEPQYEAVFQFHQLFYPAVRRFWARNNGRANRWREGCH